MRSGPIGVFDSGLGGLSVARWIKEEAPEESLLYIADTAFCPYGGRPIEEIRQRSLAIGRYAEARGAKVLVVACNSASAAALEALRADLGIPVVGMEPAVKPAARATRNGKVGVMATPATLGADRFSALMSRFGKAIDVVPLPCPGLVELVEQGEVRGPAALAVLRPLLQQFIVAEVDTVVLGCTHYPFLADSIKEVLGDGVVLVDPGPAVARQALRVVTGKDARVAVEASPPPPLTFVSTSASDSLRDRVSQLWSGDVRFEAGDI